jgi:hypothetical protein
VEAFADLVRSVLADDGSLLTELGDLLAAGSRMASSVGGVPVGGNLDVKADNKDARRFPGAAAPNWAFALFSVREN